MGINFAAASTAGLNNPGTEIVTLVKDRSGNFINPPSYDKILAYLRSGEVPMLFVTDAAGETGSLCQLVEYSETENKIRFGNDTNVIEFCAGCESPNVYDTGGSSGGGVTTLHINVTAINMETMEATFTADKTPSEMEQASVNGPIWCVVSFEAGTMGEAAVSVGVQPTWVGGVAFGMRVWAMHDPDGNNEISCAVARETPDTWKLDLKAFMN